MSTPQNDREARDARAAARSQRQGHHLQLPPFGAGRAELIRSRSPSPSAPGTFPFPPIAPSPKRSSSEIQNDQFQDALAFQAANNMASLSVDDIVRIATASAQAAARELAPRATVPDPTAAAVIAAASTNIKKVELPTFDRNNIHTWIRRVEAAFGRAGVTTAQDKFFFIESKIDVNLNPKVNEFLCGDSTEEKWEEFLEYLQSEYGRSKEQQATLFLRGIPREGLRPTQHLAKIRDLTKDITLDDLIKEMVLKDLPANIRQSLAERTNLSPDEAAKAADFYFDKDGQPKHKTTNPTINALVEATEETEDIDKPGQIHAVNRDRFRGGRPSRGFTRPSRPPPRNNTDRNRYPNPSNSRPPTPRQGGAFSSQRVCRYHLDFGDKAHNCEPGCQFGKQGNMATGNGMAGRRK